MAELLVDSQTKSAVKKPIIAKKVLFVKNLPYDTKDDEFEKAFSDIGPVRKCFLIREKDSSRKCRGFGYVTFAIEEDAQKAKDTVKTLRGRPLRITFSEKKPRQNRKKESSKDDKHQSVGDDNQDHDDDDDDNNDDLNNTNEDTKEKSPEKRKRKPKSERSQPETDSGRTVLLFGLPATISSKELYKRCRKVGELEKTVFPLEDRNEPVAALTFKTPIIARSATSKLNHKTIKGKEVIAVLKSKEHNKQLKKSKSLKKSRLIIRNLSFKCTEGLLREVFSQCDETPEVHIPMHNKHKRSQGFGFVQFSNVFSAANALKEMNLKQVLGRPMAVDWAVSKGQYELVQNSRESENACSAEAADSGDVHENQGNDKENGEDKSDDDDDSDDGDDGGDESPKKSRITKGREIVMEKVKEDDEEESDDQDGDDDDEEEEEEEEEAQKGTKKPSDVKEGLTLFVRNVNYDTTEKSLHKCFKKYGDVAYCKIVTDPATEHSKGTAFVKFKSLESVKKCMDGNADGDAFFLDGYKLQVDIAVTRGKAEQLRQNDKDSKKEPKDKRNLYLAREGVISAGSEAAQDLTKADLLKRQKAEAEKKAKLQNPNCFVSTTRLCARNLPLHLTETELKKVFSTAAAHQTPATVKKVLIIRSKERVDSTGQGRSLGFAFVEFTNHKDALAALRSTNNNPKTFGPDRRPIVEFSIENSLALKAKEQRMMRSKSKLKQSDEGPGNKTHKEKRQEKAIQRREKRQERKKRKTGMEGNKDINTPNQDGKTDATQKQQKIKISPEKSITEKARPNTKKSFSKNHPKSFGNKNVKKPITQASSEVPGNELPVRGVVRSNKRKDKDTKEETEFNIIVQKYKNKLFGETDSIAKRARWYE